MPGHGNKMQNQGARGVSLDNQIGHRSQEHSLASTAVAEKLYSRLEDLNLEFTTALGGMEANIARRLEDHIGGPLNTLAQQVAVMQEQVQNKMKLANGELRERSSSPSSASTQGK
eukprot:gnl/TRDRNA2_/TRDRNA2_169406_c0_seq1.p1 gnl/TRDRNA2_/TRDRNA2_169406_c0~~gnl/TRDRNA2_/TRDRNA2_169406_c0_seq1.p1  ORF type:complete len:135 (+),score=33.60 gnl/TRDRNA2_/TRDRNA2_169406_c0_seq1:63-407(+)